MSLSNFEDFFERGQWDFAVPQRLRHMYFRLCGTFQLAFQSVSTNLLQGTLSHYLSRMLFFNFLFFSLALCTLLVLELLNGRKFRDEDFDLLVVIRKVARRESWANVVLNFIVITFIGELIGFILMSNYHITVTLACFLAIFLFLLTLFLKVLIFCIDN